MHYAQTLEHIDAMRSLIGTMQIAFVAAIGIAFLSIFVRIVLKVRGIFAKATRKSSRSGRTQVIDAVCYDFPSRYSTQDDDDRMIVDQFSI